MTPDHPWMWHWSGMWFFPVIMFGVMIILFIVFFRRGCCKPSWGHPRGYQEQVGETDTALGILKKRYAKGELSRDEYEQMKKDILKE